MKPKLKLSGIIYLMKRGLFEISQTKNVSAWRFLGGLFTLAGRRKLEPFLLKSKDYIIRNVFRKPTLYDLEYSEYLERTPLSKEVEKKMIARLKAFNYKPIFSIILPVYKSDIRFLNQCIESVFEQVYPYWELCISDDFSNNPELKKVLDYYSGKDQRVKVCFRDKNGHISENSNSALKLATGDFVAFLDHDDLLPTHALFRCAEMLQLNNNYDVIYSDEDKIDEEGSRMNPFFKPEFGLDTLLSRNYICHLSVVRRSIVENIGGFNLGLEGSQDHDLLLRACQKASAICHIPEVLYHWRLHSKSTTMGHASKPYAVNAGKKAVENHLMRIGRNGKVLDIPNYSGCYYIDYDFDSNSNLSIILSSEFEVSISETYFRKIASITGFKSIQVLFVVDKLKLRPIEGSALDRITRLFENFEFVPIEKNLPQTINAAIKKSSADYLLILTYGALPEKKDAFCKLAKFAQFGGVVGSRVLSKDLYIVNAGIRINQDGKIINLFSGLGSENPGYFNNLKCINNQSTFSISYMMIKKSAFDTVNGFDMQLDGELAAADLCLKLSILGYQNIYIPDAAIILNLKFGLYKSEPVEKAKIDYFLFKWRNYLLISPSLNPNLDAEKPVNSIKL